MRSPAPLTPAQRLSVVQRPHRKAHAATLAPGADTWVALCGRRVPAAGATFAPRGEEIAAADEHEHTADMCVDCASFLAFAAYVADLVLASTRIRRAS